MLHFTIFSTDVTQMHVFSSTYVLSFSTVWYYNSIWWRAGLWLLFSSVDEVKMYCPYCLKEQDVTNFFCTKCGKPLTKQSSLQKHWNVLGIVSFCISVFYAVACLCVCVPVVMVQYRLYWQLGGSLFLDWICTGIVPLALSILGTIAYKSRNKHTDGNMLTLVGLIVSWSSFAACIGMAFTMLFMLF